ncbi:MAG: 16S rRNA (cytosine(1402)-N(4))-methyltransferase RsmH [Synergistaceae bacterium]|nr:16S rRNA (cytosine(1402)-N(4))-methyltransferase RsmH [Synergistaceae bacterium]MBQ9595292.1 16S rRNA (cytosine(1402)-N(4))-methyltransferase RsmH [Synergistaceae bacterium]
MNHTPVMLNEVLDLIAANTKQSRLRVLDATLGLGGYSEAVLAKFPDSYVLGIDRDGEAVRLSRERLRAYEEGARFEARHSNFGDIGEIISSSEPFDVFMFDLGVSNMQLTLPERGFSFNSDGLLDMRMNPSGDSRTAADVLRELDEKALAKIFWDYGEERFSRVIASAVKNSKSPITTTSELVNVIRSALPQPVQRKMGTHPARRIFQALRIFVNNETEELERVIMTLGEVNYRALIIFVSYHSLEDRLVKHSFRQWKSGGKGEILTRHPLTPSESELESNYKSRSAKLRAFLSEKSNAKFLISH